MSVCVIWIDRVHAKLFHFSNEKMERKTFKSDGPDHHTHHSHQHDALDERPRERRFHAELASHLKDASQLLILGPGIAKHHFQNYLVEQDPMLAKKVVACETVDHPTDNQIASLARHFFKMGVQSQT